MVSFAQNLKDVLADLVPKEQSRIKEFKQQHGKTNIGQITVDMVSDCRESVALYFLDGLVVCCQGRVDIVEEKR